MENAANVYSSHESLKSTSTRPSQGHKNHPCGLSPAPFPLCLAQPHLSLFPQHLHHAFPCPPPVAEVLQQEEPGGLPLMPQKQCNPVAFLDAQKEGNEQPLV